MLALPLIAMAILLVACGGGSSTTATSPEGSGGGGSPPGGNAGGGRCGELLTQDEVAAAFGGDVGAPVEHAAGGGGLSGVACQWLREGTLAADVSVFSGPSATVARSQLDQDKGTAAGEDVAGVGDAAFFSQFTGVLEATQGSTLVKVAVGAPQGQTDFSGLLPKDKQLMALVLGRA